MDFTLVKEGQKEPIADSGHSDFYLRSVHLEVELEAGNYIVYVGKSFFFCVCVLEDEKKEGVFLK